MTGAAFFVVSDAVGIRVDHYSLNPLDHRTLALVAVRREKVTLVLPVRLASLCSAR